MPAANRDRANATIGVVLMVALVVALSGIVAAGLLDVARPDPAPQVAVDLRVDADSDRVTLAHLAGDAINVTRLSLVVRVDGEELAHQPPVPFFAAEGFNAGPTGPFNVAADPTWESGERASFRIAGTNDPTITAGSTVSVTLVVDDRAIVTVEVAAGK